MNEIQNQIIAELREENEKLRNSVSGGVGLIATERQRQLELGWSAEHDDAHKSGELAIIAAELAVNGTDSEVAHGYITPDVWGLVRKHAGNRLKQLVIAGALIAAEIDRETRREAARKAERTGGSNV